MYRIYFIFFPLGDLKIIFVDDIIHLILYWVCWRQVEVDNGPDNECQHPRQQLLIADCSDDKSSMWSKPTYSLTSLYWYVDMLICSINFDKISPFVSYNVIFYLESYSKQGVFIIYSNRDNSERFRIRIYWVGVIEMIQI